jgi:hypothetical protein
MRRFVYSLLLVIAGCGGTPSAPSGSGDPIAPADPTPRAPDSGAGAVALTDDFGGRQLFPPDNWWNQEISTAPLDPQSDAYINFIGRTRGAHPDFGPPPYGIPYVGVSGSQARIPISFVDYGDESDTGFRGETGYPVPDGARSQPNFIEGGVAGGGTSGDRHLLIVDRDRWVLFELFAARWNASRNRWEAGSGAVFDLSSNTRRPEGWTSADAAGLAILPGLVRYGPGDSTGPRPLRRSDAWPDSSRIPHDGAEHQRLRLAGIASCRQHDRRAVDGCAAPAARIKRHLALPAVYPEHLPCDADLRVDRRRQRQRFVRDRLDGRAVE